MYAAVATSHWSQRCISFPLSPDRHFLQPIYGQPDPHGIDRTKHTRQLEYDLIYAPGVMSLHVGQNISFGGSSRPCGVFTMAGSVSLEQQRGRQSMWGLRPMLYVSYVRTAPIGCVPVSPISPL